MRAYFTWIALPVIAYLLSFLWLGSAMLFVHIVVLYAPAGLLALFDPSYRHNVPSEPKALAICHLLFWSLFLLGFANAKNPQMPVRVLRAIFTVVVIILILTMYGCARYHSTDPSDWH